MIMTLIVWLIAIAGIVMWIITFTYLYRDKIYAWFDNRYGKDDPMPPMPATPPPPLQSTEKSGNKN